MSASDSFPAPIEYPPLTPAVTPDEVDNSLCDHRADPPICVCVHDWRIEWGNVSRAPKPKATFIQ
ncbi:head-tail connector protein [Mycobacterium phage MS619]